MMSSNLIDIVLYILNDTNCNLFCFFFIARGRQKGRHLAFWEPFLWRRNVLACVSHRYKNAVRETSFSLDNTVVKETRSLKIAAVL